MRVESDVEITFHCPSCGRENFKKLHHLVGHEVREDYARDIEEVVLEFVCYFCSTICEIKVFPLF